MLDEGTRGLPDPLSEQCRLTSRGSGLSLGSWNAGGALPTLRLRDHQRTWVLPTAPLSDHGEHRKTLARPLFLASTGTRTFPRSFNLLTHCQPDCPPSCPTDPSESRQTQRQPSRHTRLLFVGCLFGTVGTETWVCHSLMYPSPQKNVQHITWGFILSSLVPSQLLSYSQFHS